jgi:hypothetical protein
VARKTRDHVRPLPGVSGADIVVKLTTDRGLLREYSIVLRMFEQGKHRPVRLYDYIDAHAEHHMHRYTSTGIKEPPEVLTYSTIQDGLDAAFQQIAAAANEMIESWRRQRKP